MGGHRKNGTARDSDKKAGQTIDAETGKPVPTPRRIDLSTLRDVRLELAAVYRKMDSGEIESQEGTRRAYVLKTIGEIIELSDLERRIKELEARPLSADGSAGALPCRTH